VLGARQRRRRRRRRISAILSADTTSAARPLPQPSHLSSGATLGALIGRPVRVCLMRRRPGSDALAATVASWLGKAGAGRPAADFVRRLSEFTSIRPLIESIRWRRRRRSNDVALGGRPPIEYNLLPTFAGRRLVHSASSRWLRASVGIPIATAQSRSRPTDAQVSRPAAKWAPLRSFWAGGPAPMRPTAEPARRPARRVMSARRKSAAGAAHQSAECKSNSNSNCKSLNESAIHILMTMTLDRQPITRPSVTGRSAGRPGLISLTRPTGLRAARLSPEPAPRPWPSFRDCRRGPSPRSELSQADPPALDVKAAGGKCQPEKIGTATAANDDDADDATTKHAYVT
jgi:hypothetical protein